MTFDPFRTCAASAALNSERNINAPGARLAHGFPSDAPPPSPPPPSPAGSGLDTVTGSFGKNTTSQYGTDTPVVAANAANSSFARARAFTAASNAPFSPDKSGLATNSWYCASATRTPTCADCRSASVAADATRCLASTIACFADNTALALAPFPASLNAARAESTAASACSTPSRAARNADACSGVGTIA